MSWRRRLEPHRRNPAVSAYLRTRLQRRLFLWFGATIFVTLIVAGVILVAAGEPERRWAERVAGFERFAGARFAEVWHDPVRRHRLADSFVQDLAISVVLRDATGRELERRGPPCSRRPHPIEVRSGARRLGSFEACTDAYRFNDHSLGWALSIAAVLLWGAAGWIARWLTRPLVQLIGVAHELGRGNLSARMQLGRFGRGELAILAGAVNEMASRIEKQLQDQRELLAAVSHEIRTPLGHLRVLLEFARDRAVTDPAVLDDIDEEIVAIDTLVGQLLASSRVDFGTLESRMLVGADLAVLAVERANLDPTLLEVCAADTRFAGDAALVLAALANLLRNAVEHGGGPETLRVTATADHVIFVVEDRGPGFTPQDLERCFESFHRGEARAGGSLGLGLSLVRRIALAHDGDAWAHNREVGGAEVGFSLGRAGRH